MELCPLLDARLTCGAASFYEAIHAAFADARQTPFQRRLSHLYDRKDDAPIIFQTDQHRQRFEAQKLYLRKPDHRSLAVLYLLTADHTLWSKTRRYFSDRGKVDLQAVRLGDVSTDCYALWKAVKELQRRCAMLKAVISHNEQATIVELPMDRLSLQYELSQIGIRRLAKDIPIMDEEDQPISVKLYSESDIGQNLAMLFRPSHSLEDANVCAHAVVHARPEVQDEIEQSIVYGQYHSPQAV